MRTMPCAQDEGTGLGMAITKYIVDKAEGSIGLKSELGKGTEFHVTFDFERGESKVEERFCRNGKSLW